MTEENSNEQGEVELDFSGFTVLGSIFDDSGEITIKVSPDRLGAYLFLIRGGGDEAISAKIVHKLLEDKKVKAEVNEKAINDAIESLAEPGDRVSGILIAEGKACVDGVDAEIDFKYDRENPFVVQGAELIRVSEPTEGEEGVDIFGQSIEPVPGKPLKIKPGEGIKLTESDNTFVAARDGNVILGRNVLLISESISIKILENQTVARLTFNDKNVTRQQINSLMMNLGITKGIHKEDIEQAVEVGVANDMIMAKTHDAVEGRDAKVEYYFNRKDGNTVRQDGSGKVDYKNQNMLKMLDPGTRLVKLVPAVRGREGIDIFGTALPVRDVKEIKISPGMNVTVEDEEDAKIFISEIRGAPVIKAGKLIVTDEYEVDGDLDLREGNVVFEGSIKIAGGIPDGFKVASKRDVTINGTVGAAEITGEKGVTVLSGFKGKHKGLVISGADLKAKYLDDITVRVEDNVLIDREIVGSTVSCRGMVNAPNAAVVGGEMTVLGGADVNVLGSEAYVRTVILIGEDFKLNEYREQTKHDLEKMQDEELELNQRLAQVKSNPAVLKRMTADMKEKFKAMLVRLKEISAAREEITQEIGRLQMEAQERRKGELIIRKMLYPGTYIKIGFSEQEVKAEIKGPVKVTEDLENQRIAFSSM